MSKEKRPPEEEKDKRYIEISLPTFGNVDMDEGRVFRPGVTRLSCWFLFGIIVAGILITVFHLPKGFYAILGMPLLLIAALFLLGLHEIIHDHEGFSICLGKKVIRRYTWDDVTGVNNQKQVYIHGKKQLLIEPSMSGYEAFYARARAACKNKRRPAPPTKKEGKNHKKNIP